MKELINLNVLEMVPYKPGKPVEELKREHNLSRVVKLASNENPFGVPPNVDDAIKQEISHINSYPENDSYYLKESIAHANGVQADNIIVGAGSVEIICMIVNAFLKPGQTVLTSEKTFLMYRIAAIQAMGKLSIIEAPMNDSYTYDLEAIYNLIDDRTKIIFIANPNNPTGTMLKKEEVISFINNVPEDRIIVFDNAYQEYVNHSADYPDAVNEAINRKNIVVLRTFSKIFALAGLRVGYGISNKEMISYLNRIKPPFNVTRLAQAAAIASLQNTKFQQESRNTNSKNRDRLFQQLKEMGLKVIPSEANFLLFFPNVDIQKLNGRLLEEGVIIRPLQPFGVKDGMRVTVGLKEDNDYFVEKLKKVLEEM